MLYHKSVWLFLWATWYPLLHAGVISHVVGNTMWNGAVWASHSISNTGCVALVLPVVNMDKFSLVLLMLTFCMVHGVGIRIFVLSKRNLILSLMILICLWILQDGCIIRYTYLHYSLPSVVHVALRYIFIGGPVWSTSLPFSTHGFNNIFAGHVSYYLLWATSYTILSFGAALWFLVLTLLWILFFPILIFFLLPMMHPLLVKVKVVLLILHLIYPRQSHYFLLHYLFLACNSFGWSFFDLPIPCNKEVWWLMKKT